MLRVRDVAASIAYYCDKLGCSVRWQHGEGRPIIAEVERRDLAIILDSESVVPKSTCAACSRPVASTRRYNGE